MRLDTMLQNNSFQYFGFFKCLTLLDKTLFQKRAKIT